MYVYNVNFHTVIEASLKFSGHGQVTVVHAPHHAIRPMPPVYLWDHDGRCGNAFVVL